MLDSMIIKPQSDKCGCTTKQAPRMVRCLALLKKQGICNPFFGK